MTGFIRCSIFGSTIEYVELCPILRLDLRIFSNQWLAFDIHSFDSHCSQVDLRFSTVYFLVSACSSLYLHAVFSTLSTLAASLASFGTLQGVGHVMSLTPGSSHIWSLATRPLCCISRLLLNRVCVETTNTNSLPTLAAVLRKLYIAKCSIAVQTMNSHSQSIVYPLRQVQRRIHLNGGNDLHQRMPDGELSPS